ncbi:M24 family metallopeptidase [Clostridium sp. 'deep sea']|uniref:M24 family metallopeptidase n=1 Tax=Clostridium sp. 'deep sea' TaxID=2779445 RepID=UPI0018968822|nr:M24 family metallopeptidase [Clostridium sp. 'deep sea']QOR36109.1 M24 family metallopeptidase [Clostridium sp. 'deep sea']
MTSEIKSLREQANKHNEWLKQKIKNVLPQLMKEQNVDTWLIISREYNDDPALKSLLPLPMVNGDEGLIMPTTKGFMFLVFHLNKENKLSAVMIGGPSFTTIEPYKNGDYKGCNEWQSLVKYLSKKNIHRLALNYSQHFSHTDSLKLTEYNLLKKHLPKSTFNKIVSSEQLCLRWLEYRNKNEIEIYPELVKISHNIIADCFSAKVVKPGFTSAEDISWHMRQSINDLGLSAWFMPMVSFIREGYEFKSYKGVVNKGDILHCDMGIRYYGLLADTQQLGYILKDSESKPPLGLLKGMQLANQLQNIHMSCFKEGKTGNEILADIHNQMMKNNINGKVWTHPIGYHGHGAGPLIGTYINQQNVAYRGDISLKANTCYAMELCIFYEVPEWNNQQVSFNLEETIGFISLGCGKSEAVYFSNKQTEYYLI